MMSVGISLYMPCVCECRWGIHLGRAQYRDELYLTRRANNGITRSVFTAILWF